MNKFSIFPNLIFSVLLILSELQRIRFSVKVKLAWRGVASFLLEVGWMALFLIKMFYEVYSFRRNIYVLILEPSVPFRGNCIRSFELLEVVCIFYPSRIIKILLKYCQHEDPRNRYSHRYLAPQVLARPNVLLYS